MSQGIVFFALLFILYWLPFIVACRRRKADGVAIGILNAFLGWTFIGWVIALIWAYRVDYLPSQPIHRQPEQDSIVPSMFGGLQ
jgi:hypothetical protein